MPGTKRLRRFEPRFGVSQPMLDEESRWVKQEWDDYLLLSVNELKETLIKRQAMLVAHAANLSHGLSRLPERERLAIQCMLARDFIHIGLLFETCLATPPDDSAEHDVPLSGPSPSSVTFETLPFRTSLFDT